MTNASGTELMVDPLVKFTAELFSKISQDKDNAILSPISVHKGLNLVLLGAGEGSQSQLDLIRALGYGHQADCERYHERYAEIIKLFEEVSETARKAHQDSKDGNLMSAHKSPLVETWNMVVAKNAAQFKETYLKSVDHYYSSSAEVVHDREPETKTRLLNKVNEWAKEAGFDSQVLTADELDKPFSALLLSAVRVEAFWFREFGPIKRQVSFYNYGVRQQPVENGEVLVGESILNAAFVEFKKKATYSERRDKLLQVHQENFEQLEALNFHVVKVDLTDGLDYLMIEPSECANGSGLAELVIELLKDERLAQMLNIVDSPEAEAKIGHLEFPSFKFENDLSLREPLKQIGLASIFDKDSAGLSEMVANRGVYIDEAKHQAVVEVNENGLKAAAITKMMAMCGFSPLAPAPVIEPIRIFIKNPFMFIVRYKGLPLFIGQLVRF